jgi:hypothetical protein
MKIGRRIYYDLLTGNVILDKGEMQGSVIETTVDQDFFSFLELKQRDRTTVGVKELEFGEFAQDFATCNGIRVDLDTKELLFSYPSGSQELPVFQKPLTEQLAEVKQQLVQQNEDLQGFMDFYFSTLA